MIVRQKDVAVENITLMLGVYSPVLNDACVVEECVQGPVLPEQTVPQMSTATLLAPRGCTPLVTLVWLRAQDTQRYSNGNIWS
jgi:hypothetical protein